MSDDDDDDDDDDDGAGAGAGAGGGGGVGNFVSVYMHYVINCVYVFLFHLSEKTPSYWNTGPFRGPCRSLGADYWLFYSPGTPKGREQQKGNGIFVGNLEFLWGSEVTLL